MISLRVTNRAGLAAGAKVRKLPEILQDQLQSHVPERTVLRSQTARVLLPCILRRRLHWTETKRLPGNNITIPFRRHSASDSVMAIFYFQITAILSHSRSDFCVLQRLNEFSRELATFSFPATGLPQLFRR